MPCTMQFITVIESVCLPACLKMSFCSVDIVNAVVVVIN